MRIEVGKKYRTRGGRIVEVLRIDHDVRIGDDACSQVIVVIVPREGTLPYICNLAGRFDDFYDDRDLIEEYKTQPEDPLAESQAEINVLRAGLAQATLQADHLRLQLNIIYDKLHLDRDSAFRLGAAPVLKLLTRLLDTEKEYLELREAWPVNMGGIPIPKPFATELIKWLRDTKEAGAEEQREQSYEDTY